MPTGGRTQDFVECADVDHAVGGGVSRSDKDKRPDDYWLMWGYKASASPESIAWSKVCFIP